VVIVVVMVVVAVWVVIGDVGRPTVYEHRSEGDATNMKSQAVEPTEQRSVASITDLSSNARVTTRFFCPTVKRFGSRGLSRTVPAAVALKRVRPDPTSASKSSVCGVKILLVKSPISTDSEDSPEAAASRSRKERYVFF